MKRILLLLVVCVALPAHAVFKCVDENGITHYGDTMPSQCAKKEITEMSKGGNVIKKHEAPLSPEQVKAREAEQVRQQAEQRQVAEQRQKDLALLSVYGSEREFEAERQRMVKQLDSRIAALEKTMAETRKSLEKQKRELEFYEAGKSKTSAAREPPPALVAGIARDKRDLAQTQAEIEKIGKEKEDLGTRQTREIIRWKRLREGMAPGTILDDQGKVLITPAPVAAERPQPKK